jgi:hypothetical protein
MTVQFLDPELQRIAAGTVFPGYLPRPVAKALQGCVLWMEASSSPADVHSLAVAEGTMALPSGYALEYSISEGIVTVVGVHAPVRST